MKLRHIALMASSLLVMGAAQASFTGDYAANNWTTAAPPCRPMAAA